MDIQALKKQFTEADTEEDRLRGLLSTAVRAKQAIARQITELRWGLKEGVIVRYRDDPQKLFKVARFSVPDDPFTDSKPWIWGFVKKKDGTWGTAERYLYGFWEIVKDE